MKVQDGGCQMRLRWMVASLALGSLPAWSQTAGEAAELPWKAANEAVAEFPRGHADVLKWEQSRQAVEAGQAAAVPSLQLASAADAVRLAWQARPKLAQPLARLVPSDVELIASGRWLELDPALSRRIDHFDDVIEAAAQARKAWTASVASQLIAAQMEQAQAAAQVADELGARMVSVGNWSRLQQAQVQLARHGADADLRRARYQAVQAQASLIQLLQLNGIHASVGLPAQLPELPAQSFALTQIQQYLARSQAWLTPADRIKHQVSAAVAQEAYLASHAIARSAREVQKLSALIAEEIQLHYNGMLKSSWDLLAEVQNQSQAQAGALAARRDFELARIDLQSVLLGAELASPLALGAGGSDAPQSAGH